MLSIFNHMQNYLKITLIHCLPQHSLSRLIYRLTRIEFKPFKSFLINLFIRIYGVDMSLALNTNPGDYRSFNAFFTRKLKKNARNWVIDSSFILSPVDGAVSQIGYIDDCQLLQAKNKKYSIEQLLGGDVTLARNFLNGSFATLYLAPHDYHRIHMPVTGRLITSIYVPGDLFPVNAASVENVNQLFARNERFISIFETGLGLMAQIMVGAIFVGSMETVWLDEITPTKKRKLTIKEYNNQSIKLNQADEFGHFNMGSTVILLFQKDKLLWLPNIKKNSLIEVGQLLGNEII
jgi:phosphatidylserine decarboxylase